MPSHADQLLRLQCCSWWLPQPASRSIKCGNNKLFKRSLRTLKLNDSKAHLLLVPQKNLKVHTAIGAGLPGTFTAHGSPARNEGRPSTRTLIPGNIKSAPPMMNRETSPPFSIKAGKSSGTFHRAKTAMVKQAIKSKKKKKKVNYSADTRKEHSTHFINFTPNTTF